MMTEPSRVLITGTSQGIGRELLKQYAASGAEVIAVDRQPPPDDLRTSFPSTMFFQADIADPAAVERLVDSLEAEDRLPTLYLFNAAIHVADNDPDLDYALLRRVLEVDLLSTLHFLSLVMPRLRGPATFVFCSSGVVIFPNPAYLGYFLSKLAITRTFDLFADRYARRGFRFKSAVLGPLRTEMLQRSAAPKGFVHALREWTTGDPTEAARRIVAFARGPRRRMYYRRLSAFVLCCARLVQSLLPSSLKAYQATPPSPRTTAPEIAGSGPHIASTSHPRVHS